MIDETKYRTPGQLIQELMDARGWTQEVVSTVLGVGETVINKIINGKRSLDAEMAISFGKIFNVPAENFLNLQKSYELAQARLFTMDDPSIAKRAKIFGSLPVSEMIKRGWLDADDIRDFPKVESAINKFFGAPNFDAVEIFSHAAKKTAATSDATPIQIAWLYRVKQIAAEMLVAPYSTAGLQSAISKLKDLRISQVATRKVPKILAECGIRYVIVESLPGAKIDGVCFWLDAKNPVIGMSLRFDRIDNFWFVLRHELEHVLRGHGLEAAMLDVDLEGERAGTGDNIAEEERVANAAAAEFCVPQKSLQNFISRKQPFFYEREILGFAATMQVHPGLVAGQLRHALFNRGEKEAYRRFTEHLVKVRSAVSPGATVDGWGDVVPVG